MTFTSVINSCLMILGPVIVTYFGCDINHKEGGQSTAITAGLLNLGTQAAKLIILAFVLPILWTGTDDEVESLIYKWSQITLNTLLSFSLETQALIYVMSLKTLMPHEPRKVTKIMAVACGWAFFDLISTKILKAITS